MALSADEWKERALDLGRVRERSGHSQSHIARAAGVSPRYVSLVEGSETQPSERILKAYALECKIDLDSLLLSWHRMPSDLMLLLRADPALCARLRRELSAQS